MNVISVQIICLEVYIESEESVKNKLVRGFQGCQVTSLALSFFSNGVQTSELSFLFITSFFFWVNRSDSEDHKIQLNFAESVTSVYTKFLNAQWICGLCTYCFAKSTNCISILQINRFYPIFSKIMYADTQKTLLILR